MALVFVSINFQSKCMWQFLLLFCFFCFFYFLLVILLCAIKWIECWKLFCEKIYMFSHANYSLKWVSWVNTPVFLHPQKSTFTTFLHTFLCNITNKKWNIFSCHVHPDNFVISFIAGWFLCHFISYAPYLFFLRFWQIQLWGIFLSCTFFVNPVC